MSERHVKKFYFYGFQGNLKKTPYDSLARLSADHHNPPRVELFVDDERKISQVPISDIYNPDTECNFTPLMAQEVYQEVGRYGFFGDVVRVSRYGNKPESFFYVVDQVGHLAYEKPSIAADILPFIRDIAGKLFFIGIRKGQIGSGPFALVGGFTDIKRLEMETLAQSALREAGEEIGVSMFPSGYGVLGICTPYADDIPIIVKLKNDELVSSSLNLVGTFFTSTSEREIEAGFKRVHMTTAYMTVIEIGRKLSCEEILPLLESGSDAAEVIVIPESEFASAEFREGHHREIFEAAWKRLS